MNTAAPALSPADIKLELERIFSRKHRANLTALYGRGQAGTVQAAGRTWTVVPTCCELELRAAMPAPGALQTEGKVFLVDWTERPLPLDLSCRLASGRLFQIASGTRLAVLFGARQSEPSLMGTGLATVLLSGEITGHKNVSGIMLTRKDATQRFLHAWAGFPLVDELTLADIVAWSLRSEAGPGLVERASRGGAWSDLRSELRAFVREATGTLGELAWCAWEQNLGRRFAQIAVLVDAHQRCGDAVAAGLLEGRLPELAPDFGPRLMALDVPLGPQLDAIFGRVEPKVLRPLLDEADRLIPMPSFASTRAVSPWLCSGHVAREQALAKALTAVVKSPTPETFSEMKTALMALQAHALDTVERNEEQRETRTMAARLVAWLVERAQQLPPARGTVYQPAIELATRYAEEGGFVDWCRARLRAPLPFHDSLNCAMHGALEAADALRHEDDQRFSEALVQWVAADRPANEVLPIDRVTHSFVTPLLKDKKGRKLLIILMDGMSWASAVQLLTRLEKEKWAPILWRPRGHEARRHLPPVLAGLPSLTQVSRADLFAGRRDLRAGDKNSSHDAKRWSANKDLLEANDQEALPELIMRDKLMDGADLHKDVIAAIESPHAVVGVVVNAIDEDLNGSSQTMCDYSLDPPKPLTGLLTHAAGADRFVLLASDHGHVLGDAMRSHGQPLLGNQEVGTRWRTLGSHDEPMPFERVLPSAKTWCPQGAGRVAAIWDEKVAHKQPCYGTHGGLSLAEVVCPTLLIAPEWLAQVQSEPSPELETRPFPLPGWWDLDLRPPRAKPAAEPEQRTKQVTLPGIAPAPPPRTKAPAPSAQPDLPPLVRALQDSKVFKAHVAEQQADDVAKVLIWLAVLVEAGGAMADREFAMRCHTRQHRVAGLVARMGMLNCDGYAMVEHDRAGGQVKLNEARLRGQYGLDA